MTYVKITHEDINSGTPVYIRCSSVTPSVKKNLVRQPNANGDNMSYVQTQSYENATYQIGGVHYTGASNTLTWDDIITLTKVKYDGTNYITLNVQYGDGLMLNGLSESTDIKVILESASLPLSTTESKDVRMPVGSLSFVETR